MAAILSEPNPDQKLIKQVDIELKEIRTIPQGAFAPVTQQRFLRHC
jgi:hypothetical protein